MHHDLKQRIAGVHPCGRRARGHRDTHAPPRARRGCGHPPTPLLRGCGHPLFPTPPAVRMQLRAATASGSDGCGVGRAGWPCFVGLNFHVPLPRFARGVYVRVCTQSRGEPRRCPPRLRLEHESLKLQCTSATCGQGRAPEVSPPHRHAFSVAVMTAGPCCPESTAYTQRALGLGSHATRDLQCTRAQVVDFASCSPATKHGCR